MKVPGILTVHNLRIWGLTTDKTALSAHLVIGKQKQLKYFKIEKGILPLSPDYK